MFFVDSKFCLAIDFNHLNIRLLKQFNLIKEILNLQIISFLEK